MSVRVCLYVSMRLFVCVYVCGCVSVSVCVCVSMCTGLLVYSENEGLKEAKIRAPFCGGSVQIESGQYYE